MGTKRDWKQMIHFGIGFKVFIVYIVSIMTVILFTGFLFYQRSDRVIQTQLGEIAKQTIEQTRQRLESVLNEYEDRTLLMLVNEEIQLAMNTKTDDPYKKMQIDKQLQAFMTNVLYAKKDTLNVFVIGENDYNFRYSSSKASRGSTWSEGIDRDDWRYKRVWEANGEMVFFGVGSSIIAGEDEVFMFGRTLKDVDRGFKRSGIILYEVKPDAIEAILRQVNFNGDGYTYLIDNNGQIVAAPDRGQLGRYVDVNLKQIENNNAAWTKKDGEAYFTIFNRLETLPWTVVGFMPLELLFRASDSIGWYMVYLSLFFIVFSVIISWLVARYVHRPIALLLRNMRITQEGDFTKRINVKRKDEFNVIFSGFNDMIARIKSLIDELYTQQMIKKEMQFKLLGSQINMHFLYNILNSIYWMGKMGKSEEITVMVRSLSDYFQLSLSEGSDELTVKEIYRLLESYLTVQGVRYKDKFSMEMVIEGDIADRKLLKHLFQPIVENAIYHGLEKKKTPGQGQLSVTFQESGDRIHFIVSDNGAGIPEAKLIEIHQIFEGKDIGLSGNFALKNIKSQIQLKYGMDYGVSIESKTDQGTCVILSLPKL